MQLKMSGNSILSDEARLVDEASLVDTLPARLVDTPPASSG